MSYSNNPYARPPPPTYPAAAQAGPYLPPGYVPPAVAGPSYDAYSTYHSSTDPAARIQYIEAEYARSDYDVNAAQQASVYTPGAAARGPLASGSGVAGAGATSTLLGGKGGPRKTVLRKGGGQLWEDQTLMEWDPTHFRLFIGDLDPALSDDLFAKAFSGVRYPSFVKAKIIRDKYTNKGKGFGFVSYKDPEDFLKAWKELNGTYVGTRPVKISRASTGVAPVEIGKKKARELDLKHKKKSGTVAFERAKAVEAAAGGPNSGGGKDRKSYIRR